MLPVLPTANLPVRKYLAAAALTSLIGAQVAALMADETITILPREFTLTGSEARQQIVVEELRAGLHVGQVAADKVAFESSNPQVVRISNGVVVPVGNGEAVVTAKIGERAAIANVKVVAFDVPNRWSFRNHVQSIFSKTGCNSGACHGAAAGKNGFKLSLRGYDPDADYFTVTRQSRGRRVVPSDPGRSLILTKPTGAIPHKGGVRFDVNSLEYRVIAEWIAAGQAGPATSDPRLERLELLPDATVLKKGDSQQLLVRAHFSDGKVEDVTRWAKYTSTNQTVARVDDNGLVSITGNGEGAVVAWYLAKNGTASITVPYENPVSPEVFANAARANFIDDLVLAKLQNLNIPPSPDATDSEFLRRASLDTIGLLPTADEVRAFLADTAPDKREKLVDKLLSRPEYVDYWTHRWSDLLLVTGAKLRPPAVEAYSKWIRTQVAENTPWNEFAHAVVTARGSTLENGAANFYALHEDPQDMAETVSMAFLGMSINCARCHDHPLEKWTNDDYYGMANLFARVRSKGWGGASESGDGNRVVFVATEGELIQPRTAHPQTPKPLDGTPISFDATADRRNHLSEWLTSPENPYFSRAVVNRIWANYLGVGLVESIDDMRLTNPPSNERLLAAMSKFLVENNYDLKALMRVILNSKTYQRSSRPAPGNEADDRFYSHSYPRRLKAEVLLDALSQVAEVPTEFKGKPAGTRALELADADVESYFLKTFGRPERIITCECERTNEPSMVQVLHITNGDTLNGKLEAKNNRISRLMTAKATPQQIVQELYLAALARLPQPEEEAKILAALAESREQETQAVLTQLRGALDAVLAERDPAKHQEATEKLLPQLRAAPDELAAKQRQAFEDVFWSVLSSREFLFNH